MIHPRTLQALEFDKIISRLANHCCSEAGRAAALERKPFARKEDAEAALGLFSDYLVWASQPEIYQAQTFPDTRSLTEAVKAKAGPNGLSSAYALDLESFWALRETLRLAQRACTAIHQPQAADNWPALLDMTKGCEMPTQLLAALNRCISDDGLLKDESSPELFHVRSELRSLHQSCIRKVRDYAQQYNMLPYLQDEFMTLSSDRYVLPLKANFRGKMQGIIHDWSQTGETCYFEPYFLVSINNRLQELKREEREEERKVLAYLTGLLASELPGVECANFLLTELDQLNAIAKLSTELEATCLSFTEPDAGIDLVSARHPLLALSRIDKKDSTPVRPLDITLRPGERALIVTGGNAGGKTVCLKTLGLLAAMSMSGLPVPAAPGSHLPWFERIDAFIGDEQSLSDNMSTFSAQIDHLAKSFRHLNDAGLALLDEFGAGTDPAEGAALAQAVHDELLEKGCFILSATHFPGLKSYALTKQGARAASMLFDSATSKPLFRLAYDSVGSSQALAVAASHGLPESILARARRYLLQDGEDTSSIMELLNNLAAQRETELANLREQKLKADTTLAQAREKLAQERKRLQEQVSANISALMKAWKNDKATAKQTLKEMSGLREELGLEPTPAESVLPQIGNFNVGQRVFHAGFNKRGVVTAIDDRRKRVKVDLDGVGLWANMADLRAVEEARPATAKQTAGPAAGPVFSLDVRGLRAAEALAEVERFLDKAILGGSSEIEIIHGRGTGALRREIHNFLKSFPAVESLRLAPEDRGGDGMTIVVLK